MNKFILGLWGLYFIITFSLAFMVLTLKVWDWILIELIERF
jgi:hypothetical protein